MAEWARMTSGQFGAYPIKQGRTWIEIVRTAGITIE
jgi:hypothetical protein